MKVYLAASFGRKDEMRDVRAKLQAYGYTVTSRWLDQTAPGDDSSLWAVESVRDIEDVREAALVAVFTSPGVLSTGHHAELGLAIAWSKMRMIIGPPEGIFYLTPGAIYFDTIEQFLATMNLGSFLGV
jgi:hypothetical protein